MKSRKKGREKKRDKKAVYRGYSCPILRDGTSQDWDEYYHPVTIKTGLEVEEGDK